MNAPHTMKPAPLNISARLIESAEGWHNEIETRLEAAAEIERQAERIAALEAENINLRALRVACDESPATEGLKVATADAVSILVAAADCIGDRAAERDQPNGERSMSRAVAMFTAWRGDDAGPLEETEGWVFMALLKLARAACGRHRLDDYTDGAAYIALAGESADSACRRSA